VHNVGHKIVVLIVGYKIVMHNVGHIISKRLNIKKCVYYISVGINWLQIFYMIRTYDLPSLNAIS
jgi:hypothetical protein